MPRATVWAGSSAGVNHQSGSTPRGRTRRLSAQPGSIWARSSARTAGGMAGTTERQGGLYRSACHAAPARQARRRRLRCQARSRRSPAGGEHPDVVIGDPGEADPDRFGHAVDLDEADSGQAVRDLITAGAAVPGSGAEDQTDLVGLSQPQRDPDREQVPGRQGLLAGVLDRRRRR